VVSSTPELISLEPLEIVAEALPVQARWTRALINRELPATGAEALPVQARWTRALINRELPATGGVARVGQADGDCRQLANHAERRACASQ
jgi:hypothetical protein